MQADRRDDADAGAAADKEAGAGAAHSQLDGHGSLGAREVHRRMEADARAPIGQPGGAEGPLMRTAPWTALRASPAQFCDLTAAPLPHLAVPSTAVSTQPLSTSKRN